MPNDQQLSAKTKVSPTAALDLTLLMPKVKMVTDYLMLAQSLHQAADSMNAYVAVLASTSTHSDTVSLLIPPPQLPPLAPYDGPGGARIPLPNLANNRGHTESDEEAAGDGKKRRRVTKEKKPKDPNAPKRPASGYLVYQNSVRAQVKADNPDMPHKDVQAKIAADWNTMDADKKKVCLSLLRLCPVTEYVLQIYNDEASAALADWKSKTADYEKTKGDNPAEVKPVSKPASKAAAKKVSLCSPFSSNMD